MQFDVAGGVPAGATIVSATLTMQMTKTRGGGTPVALHQVLASWGEGASDASANEGRGTTALADDATWTHRFEGGEPWATEGGDFANDSSGTADVFRSGAYSWDSTPQMVADVQSWLDDPSTNHGWLLMGDESSNRTAKRFSSREQASASTRPTLTVLFTTGG